MKYILKFFKALLEGWLLASFFFAVSVTHFFLIEDTSILLPILTGAWAVYGIVKQFSK